MGGDDLVRALFAPGRGRGHDLFLPGNDHFTETRADYKRLAVRSRQSLPANLHDPR
jgi:hypothetical protein